MNSVNAARAQELFVAAIDLDPELRAEWLTDACGTDSALRAEVDRLLATYERSAEYFANLTDRLGVSRLSEQRASPSSDQAAPLEGVARGQRLGPFTLTHRIGAGGMGEVWCAERNDGRFEGRVAVKFLALPGNAAAAERFLREGKLLARLDHPNIARLIDAGVDAHARPYLVLEYVEGESIDLYANRLALSIPDRLKLFEQVVAAIAHAHRHLVVHRDLKPGNVLVTADGTVKVLDFGISRLLGADALDAATPLTADLGIALTPQFAAPEQIEGAEITTATDVYSLGMLLWSLLTDVTPRSAHEVRTLAELRALAQQDPISMVDTVTRSGDDAELAARAARRGASTVEFLRVLRSDLDNILRKATAAEPRDRYASAAEFGEDLERYLRLEPVKARAPTLPYRLRKFVRRHRGGVAAGMLTVVAIITALVVALWQGAEARRQRDFAQAQHARAQLTHEFMSFLITDVGGDGGPLTLGDLLARAETMLERQAQTRQAPNGPVLYEIASAHFSLGNKDRMVALLLQAEQASKRAHDDDTLAAALCTRARVQLRDQPEQTVAVMDEALTVYGRLRSPSAESRVACARARALQQEQGGDQEAAIATLRAALRQVEGGQPGLRPRLFLLNELSRVHYDRREFGESLQLNERILQTMRDSGLDRSTGYAINLMNRSSLLQSMGEIRAAADVQREIHAHLRHLPVAVGFERPLAQSYLRLARPQEALELLRAGEAETRRSGDAFALGENLLGQGRAELALGHAEQAARLLDEAEVRLVAEPRRNATQLRALALARCRIDAARGRRDEALRCLQALRQQFDGPAAARSPLLMQVLRAAAELELEGGDRAAALAHAEESLRLAETVARDRLQSADVGQALLLRARVLLAQGDATRAQPDLAAAETALTQGLGAEHPDTRLARDLRR